MADSSPAIAMAVMRLSRGRLPRLVSPARYLCVLALVLLWPVAAHAQESAYARDIAASCTNCHAVSAAGPGAIPAIAGRDKKYLLKLLMEFKSGARPATVMHQLARGFTDEQLDVLAGYFSAVSTRSKRARD